MLKNILYDSDCVTDCDRVLHSWDAIPQDTGIALSEPTMLTFIETVRAHFRLTRLLKAMTKQGLTYNQAVRAIEHHVSQGTVTLLEQEWLS